MTPFESGTRTVEVRVVTADDFPAIIEFAAERVLTRADFASLALMGSQEPRMIAAWADESIVAAAIDDGLATSIAGDHDGLAAIGAWIEELDEKLVIAGPIDDVLSLIHI